MEDPIGIIELLRLVAAAQGGDGDSQERLANASACATVDEVTSVEKLLEITIEPGSYFIAQLISEMGIGAILNPSVQRGVLKHCELVRERYVQRAEG